MQIVRVVCQRVRRERGTSAVVLSGGCFQNRLLLEGLTRALKIRHLEVFAHEQVPTNDGGLALGQAVVAGSAVAGVLSEVVP